MLAPGAKNKQLRHWPLAPPWRKERNKKGKGDKETNYYNTICVHKQEDKEVRTVSPYKQTQPEDDNGEAVLECDIILRSDTMVVTNSVTLSVGIRQVTGF